MKSRLRHSTRPAPAAERRKSAPLDDSAATQVREKNSSNNVITAEEVHDALDRILASKHFVHAPMKRKFLRLVCHFYMSNRASELNEYLIGREVFERDDTYNPAADPIVRVGAHDVRKKLDLYYETEGAQDAIRLEIPVGSYEPVFGRRISPPPEAPWTPRLSVRTPASSGPRGLRNVAVALGLITLLLVVTAVWLGFSNRELRYRLEQTTPLNEQSVYGSVWEPFFNDSDQTLVVLSNPPVYRFSNPIDPAVAMKRSIGLSADETEELADTLSDRFVLRQKRELRLILSPDGYTGMGEAIGLYRLTDLFRSTGKGILLKQSRTASAEDLKNHNVILLGSVWANEWSGKLPLSEDFAHRSDATIENRNPLAGESAEYRPEFDPKTGQLTVDYALVTVKPNISFEDTVMVLAGVHSEGTEAAAEYVTSKNYLIELNQKLQLAGGQSGPLKYYQVLLKVGVENGIPTTVSLVSLHELRVE